MIFSTRLQLDDRPSIGQCSLINIETGIQELSRIIVQSGDYETHEEDEENCQGIDLCYDEILMLSSVFIEFFEGRLEPYHLQTEFQMDEGVESLSISVGIEGMLSFSIGYFEYENSINNQSVSVLIKKQEAFPLALVLRACGESRKLSDDDIANDKEIGLKDDW